MEIIVTDVTRVNDDVCVAGWDERGKRMIRPLRGIGLHWPRSLANPALFHPGSIIELEVTNISNNRGYPHKTEDIIVSPLSLPKKVGEVAMINLTERVRGSVSTSITQLFAGQISGRFVPDGAQCPSLGGLDIRSEHVNFQEGSYDGNVSLRCLFRDNENACHEFKVTSLELTTAHEQEGLPSVHRRKYGKSRCHLRIGLTHPYERGCVAMVNGAYFY